MSELKTSKYDADIGIINQRYITKKKVWLDRKDLIQISYKTSASFSFIIYSSC